MKVIAINGSPRKGWNTAALLNKALEGAASKGAETELINLYELNYRGCISCFGCKLKGGKNYGRCAANDDLRPVLMKLEEADAVILGSPIYFGTVTGEMRSFLERFMFQYLVYDNEGSTLFKKKIKTGFIYTMNVSRDVMKNIGYENNFNSTGMTLKRIFGSSEWMTSNDTYQFDDYTKYVAERFSEEEKGRIRREEFPHDCDKAFDMGARFAE